MNSAIFCSSLLICSLSSAQDYGNFSEVCYPDMCKLLEDLGALREQLRSVETRLELDEMRLSQCEIRQEHGQTGPRIDGNTLAVFEKRVEALERRYEPEVIFSAVTGGESTPLGPFDIDTTLIFDRVITNIAEAYDRYTGIFTAPVAGVYYFTFFCHAGGYHPIILYLYKNGEPIVMTRDHWTYFDTADNGGNAVFLQLQYFDQVYVVMGAQSHVWDSIYHTTFSGFLVTPMWETENMDQSVE